MKLTSILDLVGLLVLVIAGAIFIYPFNAPGGVAFAGAGLLAVSWVIDRADRAGRKGKP